MADHRESDILAYILGILVIAIGGAAVGVASTTPRSGSGENQDGAAAVMHTGAAPEKTQDTPQGPS